MNYDLSRIQAKVEDLLLDRAKIDHERKTNTPITGQHLSSILEKGSVGDAPLPSLPRDLGDSIARHLSLEDEKRVTRTWASALSRPVKASMVQKAALDYGFSKVPDLAGLKNFLKKIYAYSGCF